jgi:hypothetical protein
MKIDSEHIVKQSEEFALNIAKQISKITVRPFCEISFHSSEYRMGKRSQIICIKFLKATIHSFILFRLNPRKF